MGRKTKRGNKTNAAQAASAEAPWEALPRKDKTQPVSSSKTGLTRRTTEGGTPFEDVLDRKDKR
jgi:rubredoxin